MVIRKNDSEIAGNLWFVSDLVAGQIFLKYNGPHCLSDSQVCDLQNRFESK